MTFEEYQAAAAVFAVYPKDREREYLSLGLISEVGELAGKLKKEIRDGVDLTEAILDEISDCLWYLSQIARVGDLRIGDDITPEVANGHTMIQVVAEITYSSLRCWDCDHAGNALDYLAAICEWRNTTLEAVCERNIAKLQDRKNRDVIKGSGDTR